MHDYVYIYIYACIYACMIIYVCNMFETALLKITCLAGYLRVAMFLDHSSGAGDFLPDPV